MGKGKLKRRKTKFQLNNTCSPRTITSYVDPKVKYVRLDAETLQIVEQQPVHTEILSPNDGLGSDNANFRFLRGKPKTPVKMSSAAAKLKTCRQSDNYKILHTEKLWFMINTVTREHLQRNPNCDGSLAFDPASSQQWGFSWRERAYCCKCGYKSNIFKLYSEVETGKRGAKAATVNRGISVALTQTPIANRSVRKLCMGGNIPAPSTFCLQDNANKVSDIITAENRRDMKKRRQQLKEINKYRNRPISQITVQADGMYNNNLYSGVGRTPFQPATQATYTVAETVTSKKQIIAAEAVNKLCSKHGFHNREAEKCDIKTAPCSATACMETTIGDEHKWARNCLEDLNRDGLEVSFLTTDADTGAFRAALDMYRQKCTNTLPIHQFDTRHLAENHRKQMRNCKRILSMMPGHNSTYRSYLRGRFALDLSRRCTAEFCATFNKHNGNFLKLKEKIKYCINAIKRCYAGDHCGCQMHSLVCKGKRDDNWLINSAFLSRNFKIDLTKPQNHDAMLDWIEFRLGEDMLYKTCLNSDTQKVEGTNRAIKRSLPKNSTFSRNFPGRLNSAIHSVNNGPGESLRKLCTAAKCPIPEFGRVASQLRDEQHRVEIKRQTEMTVKFKEKRKLRRKIMYNLYEKNREQNKYIKSQLLKDRARELRLKRKQDAKTLTQPQPSTSDHTHYTRPFSSRQGKRHRGRCSQSKTALPKQ